jgi:hypothetical protein
MFIFSRPHICRKPVYLCRLPVDATRKSSFPMVDPNSAMISGSIWEGSLSLTRRLSHRVEERIYWTKVSINTFVSDGHVGAYAL